VKRRGTVQWLGLVGLTIACASPPKTTPGARELFSNARAVVEGHVVDRAGRPVAGLGVTAIPRGRDIEWSPAATTDSEGRFALTLFAPAEYAFFLSRGGKTVITSEPDDPLRVIVSLTPGERRSGVELRFLDADISKGAC
jgi:hypothetical protein